MSFMFFMGILLLAIVIEPIAAKVRLPFSAALVVVGFVSSEVMAALNYDTGIRWDNFRDLIFYGFLPILIVEAAFNLDVRLLLKSAVVIFFWRYRYCWCQQGSVRSLFTSVSVILKASPGLQRCLPVHCCRRQTRLPCWHYSKRLGHRMLVSAG